MRFHKSFVTVVLALVSMSSAFATNSFTGAGDPVVSGYWNASNTGATVQAQSWEVGIVSFKTYISVDGAGYVQFGSVSAQGGASTGQQLSFSLTATDIETTDPLSDNETFQIYVEFRNGSNVPVDTVTCTSTAITVDQTAPTVLSLSSDAAAGDYSIGESVDIITTFSEPVSSTGNIQIVVETGTPDQTVTISSFTTSSTATTSYTVVEGDESSDLSVNSLTKSSGDLRDAAGNDADLTIPGGENLDDNEAIVVDGNIPAAVNVGTVVAVGAPVATDYWNSSNTALSVTVPIPSDASLVDGSLQLKGYWGADGGTAQPLGGSETIGATGNMEVQILKAILEAFGGYTEAGVLKVVAIVTDKAGNTSPVGTESSNQITIDQTAPIVTNISSDVANGTYGISDVIDVDLTFSELVTLVGDNLQIELETDATDETFVVSAFSNSSTASANYTVAEGNVSGDLTVKSLSPLGGTLRDAAGNDATYGLPSNSNLGDNKAIIIDGVYPTITSITSSPSTGDLAIGEEVDITINFDESLTLSAGTLDLVLDVGTTVQISSVSGTSAIGTYTVADGDASSDLTVSEVNVTGGTLSDGAGNSLNEALPGGENLGDNSALVIDGNIPAAVNVGTIVARVENVVTDYWNSTNDFLDVIVPIPADASLINGGGTIQLKGYWSENVNDAVDLWTAQTISSSGNHTLAVPEATLETFPGYTEGGVLKIVALVTDKAGNTSTAGTASANEITVDTVVPTIQSLTSSSGNGPFKPADNIVIIATFSEAVKLIGDNLQLEVETGTPDETFIISAFDYNTTASGTYTVQEDNESADLTVNSIALLGGSLRDAAGNDVDRTVPSDSNLDDNSNIVVDGVVPTIVSITSTTSAGDYAVDDVINVTVEFSEAVTLTGADLVVTLDAGGTANIGVFSSSTTATANYTVGSGDASSSLSANSPLTTGGTIVDAAGNAVNLVTIPTNINSDRTIVVDGIIPSAVNVGTVVARVENVVTDFWNDTNEYLDVIVPIPADASLTGGGGTVQLKGYWSADVNDAADLWEAQAISSSGNMTLAVPETTLETFPGYTEGAVLKVVAVVTDKAGNTSAVGTASANEITIDTTVPTILSFTSDSGNGPFIPADDINVITTFSEAVKLIGDNLQLELETGTTDETFIISAFDYNTTASGTYTVQTDNDSDDLEVISVSLLGGSLRDAAGNDVDRTLPSTSNLDDNSNIVVDGIVPTIVSITSTTAAGDYAIDDVINVTVEFSEAVTLAGADLVVALDGGGTANISAFSSSTTATAGYTVGSGDASSALLAESPLTTTGTIQDAAGNSVNLVTIPTNINSDRTIVVDGNIPASVDVGTVVARVENVVTDYWNSTNDFLDVIVPIPADASLINGGGTIQLKGYWSANVNDAVDLWTAQSILSSGNHTLAVPEAILEALPGYTEGAVLKVVAVVTDKAGNTSIVGTASSNEITIDTAVPTILSFTSDSGNGPFIPADDINVIATFSEAVKLIGDNLQIEFETGTTDETLVISAFDYNTTANGTYTVQEDNESDDLSVIGVTLLGGSLSDAAGNDVDRTIPSNSNLDDNSTIVVDGIIPTIESITSGTPDSSPIGKDGTVGLIVTFSEEVTLSVGETLVLDINSSPTDLNITSISNSRTATLDYTVLAGDEASDLSITAISLLGAGSLQDAAGNDVSNLATMAGMTNLADDYAFVIDGIDPLAFTMASATPTTTSGNVVAGYWNEDNEGMTVIVNIPDDASLTEGGTLQIQGRVASNDLVNLGAASDIDARNTPKPILIDDTDIEGMTGYDDDQTFSITALITDRAGNTTLATLPYLDFVIDEVDPTITEITSTTNDGSYSVGQNVNVTINLSEEVSLESGVMSVTLNTVAEEILTDNTITDEQVLPFTLSITEGVTANPLTVVSVTATSGQLVDAAGNEVDFSLPFGENLADNGSIVIDGEFPTIVGISATIVTDTLGLGEAVDVEIEFNEALTLSALGSLDVLFDTGQTVSITSISASSTAVATYTVGVGEESTDLTVQSITLSAGTLEDIAGNGLDTALPLGQNLGNNNEILVDGIVPLVDDTGDILTVGAPVVTGYWNLDNTGVQVILPNDGSDPSLNGGRAHLEARLNLNEFVTIGTSEALATDPVTLSLTRSDLEGIAGYGSGGTIQIRGVLTDRAGNSTNLNTSNEELIMDQNLPTAPVTGTLTVTGGNTYEDYWNDTNLELEVSIPLDEDLTLVGGRIQLESDLNSASSFAVIGADSTIISDDGIHVMTMSAADIAAYGADDGDVMTFRAIVTDKAGNEATGTIGLNTITVDYTYPTVLTVGTVTAVDNSVVDGYFNLSNSGAEVTIPLEDADGTLVGGQIQLRATVDTFDPENILVPPPHDIVDLDDVTITIDRADLITLGFYGEGRVITFDAIVTDVAGNATQFNYSTDQLEVDEVVPVASDFTELIPLGDYSNAGYWNADNSALEITIPIDTDDPSLIDGHIKMAGNIAPGDGLFEIYPSELAIGSLVATQTFTLLNAELETVTGFTDGLTMEFRYIISDIAGNETVSNTSVTTFIIDQTLPAAPDITEFTIKGENITPLKWNATSDSLLLTIPVNTDADPTLVGGFFQVQMSVGANPYSAVLIDSFSIPTFDDTIRIGLDDIEALPGYEDENLFTRILIQDRAGNETVGATETEVIVIDTEGPAPFTCGPLIATGGVFADDAYNNSNTGISVKIPIVNDTSLLNGSAILRVSMIDPITVPPIPVFENIDTLGIDGTGDSLTMTIDHATLSTITGFIQDNRIMVTADLLDNSGNQVVGAASPDTLTIDFVGPELPVVTDTTVVGGTVVEDYWNSTNEGIDLTILTPVVADPSLLGGYIQVEGRIGGDPVGTLVDTIRIESINITEIVVSIDSVDLEALSISSEGQPIDLRVTLVDGRGNDTTGAWMEDILIMDQIAPALSAFNPDGTTMDAYIAAIDTLKADWQVFTDDVSDVAYYDYSIGHTAGADDFLAWDTLLTTSVDTLMTYTHEDEYYLNVRAMDVAGNMSDILSNSVIIADLVLPTTTSAMDPYYFIDAWPGALSGTFSDDLSGMHSIELMLQRDSDSFYWDGTEWNSVDTTRFDLVLGPGTWEFDLSSDSLGNRENYIITLLGYDVAGNYQWPYENPLFTASLDTFQFVINTAPVFVDDSTYADSSAEDSEYSRFFLVDDPDVGSISADTLYWSLSENVPAGVSIDSLTGELTWLPVDSAVGDHSFTAYVQDYYDEIDSILISHRVLETNDAPEPVTLLLPADSTQLVPTDGLDLVFKWTSAFDIEDDSLTYIVSFEGTDYDTTLLPTADTTISLDVSVMDFPSSTIEWFVRALDQADTSAIVDTFHVTTSSAFASLNSDSIAVDIERMTNIDTSFTMGNLGLTDLRWSLLDAPAWISLPAETGTIEYDTSAVIAFNINPSAFTVGGYGGQFRILTNDPLQDTITVKVSMDIFDVPTPVIAFYKNRAYPSYYEMMIVDSLGMIDSLSVTHSGLEIELTTVDTFSFVAVVEVSAEGLNAFEVYASNWVGDTTITVNVTVSLIKRGAPWLARSPDEQFEIKGSSNSAAKSTRIAVLDSMLSAIDDASYKVLTDGVVLAEPVLVSMPALTNDQAIYIQDTAGDYVELASVSDGERVRAWAATMGAFKLGPRTIIVPEKSQLSQNYPNPFNPTTTIDFDIGFLDGLNQDIRFSVYNIRGQEVQNLMETQMQPGSYSIIWNGLDDQGKQVSSGIYFARLMTGKGYAKTVKMLVLR
ncbi:MAG: T9SS type A sorting domain-containing protein [FCB group bacterium]|nr:T9SS type A sorting domain-containing protein [FCB group bacterium]MBL7028950.1 T9SS type A sorting domain-containing protein [Candidatus Neomarinimicrobiota bacterium]MBL7121970.1 T9SS type A sorting domain-containing protein [Candidatus Neomarinimicrobiota bacterium]